jgi:hypothetical protein
MCNCATVMATGETLDLREQRCRCNLEYRFAYADGKRSTDSDTLVRRTSQVGRIVDIQIELKYSRLILARWQGFRRYLQVSFVS